MKKKKQEPYIIAKKLLNEAEEHKKFLSLEIGTYSEDIRKYQKEQNKPMLEVLAVYCRYLVKHYELIKVLINELKSFIGEDEYGTKKRTISNKRLSDNEYGAKKRTISNKRLSDSSS
ncbi:hypothetical protein IJD15_00545 [bacterium]|nr:hypothetical protein [bacterium]